MGDEGGVVEVSAGHEYVGDTRDSGESCKLFVYQLSNRIFCNNQET